MNADFQINRSRRMSQAEDGSHRALDVRALHPAAASCDCTGAGTARPSLRTGSPAVADAFEFEPPPIWFAALAASNCLAGNDQAGHEVTWQCVSGRALYTNSGLDAETVEPLGVRLQGATPSRCRGYRGILPIRWKSIPNPAIRFEFDFRIPNQF
jgi:hypothetical protein